MLESTILQRKVCFLLCSNDAGLGSLIRLQIRQTDELIQEAPTAAELRGRLEAIQPSILFLDFDTTDAENPDAQIENTCMLCSTAAQYFPHIPRIALGNLPQSHVTLAALRAGISDFIDTGTDTGSDIRTRIQHVLTRNSENVGTPAKSPSVLVLGARSGVGASTLVSHLATLAQERMTQASSAKALLIDPQATQMLTDRICLMDLGIPTRDNLLYLDISEGFHFVDAAQNLRRLDSTLLSSALPHNNAGLSVLALPKNLEDMRAASQADSLELFERLRTYFGLLIVDACGLSNTPFIASMAEKSDHIWIVTDQSIGAMVSLSDLLGELDQQHIERQRLRLIVNRYDLRYGMDAMQIATRFDIPLLASLPDSTLALRRGMGQNKLLTQSAPKSAYVKTVHHLLNLVLPEDSRTRKPRRAWLPSLRKHAAR